MTGALDSVFRPLAVSLIAKFGTAATLTRVTKTFVASTGLTSEARSDTAVIITPPSSTKAGEKPGTQWRLKDVVVKGGFKCMLAAQGLAVEPEPTGYTLTHDSKVWTVVDVKKVWSGNLVAAYVLGLEE